MFIVVKDKTVVFESEFLAAAGAFALSAGGDVYSDELEEVLANRAPEMCSGGNDEPRKTPQKQD